MKGIFLTSQTLTQYLQTLDNLMTLKKLVDQGYEVDSGLHFEADQWGDHLLGTALGVIFGCQVIEREITRKAANGTYVDRELVLPIEGYDEWRRLKGNYPEMEDSEKEMTEVSFDCEYQGGGLSIRFDGQGLVVENAYDDSYYAHSLLDDFFTLKHIWSESLNYWRRVAFDEYGGGDGRVEYSAPEAEHTIS
jgi:hypothetical protein